MLVQSWFLFLPGVHNLPYMFPHKFRQEAAPTPNLTHPEYPVTPEAEQSLDIRVCYPLPTLMLVQSWFLFLPGVHNLPYMFPHKFRQEAAPTPNLTHPEYPVTPEAEQRPQDSKGRNISEITRSANPVVVAKSQDPPEKSSKTCALRRQKLF
ncbi:hypothetical protein J6590_006801 [Homalodisca vitripennis]|nr:hypothetical protein J6590_006801 [Homalodisca vitripennis]